MQIIKFKGYSSILDYIWRCSDLVLMVLCACGTLFGCRNPRRGLTFLASPRKDKQKKATRGEVGSAVPSLVASLGSRSSLGLRFNGVLKPQLNDHSYASTRNLNIALYFHCVTSLKLQPLRNHASIYIDFSRPRKWR